MCGLGGDSQKHAHGWGSTTNAQELGSPQHVYRYGDPSTHSHRDGGSLTHTQEWGFFKTCTGVGGSPTHAQEWVSPNTGTGMGVQHMHKDGVPPTHAHECVPQQMHRDGVPQCMHNIMLLLFNKY